MEQDSGLPQTISHYRILKKLGEGGMGEVYLAEDVQLQRKITLKLLPPDLANNPERIGRLEREARAASALNHPNILVIHELGRAETQYFIATEFVEGDTLRDRLMRSRMSVTDVVDVMMQVLAALTVAHGAGVLHRDIKPENIMIRPDRIVKVLDFGLAKMTLDEQTPRKDETTLVATSPGLVLGTLPYMSPEQARGQELDPRTDLFSVGVVLYEALSGQRPFDGPTAADIVAKILQSNAAALSTDVPEALRWILEKSLRKDRDERYQSAKEMLADLKSVHHRLDREALAEAPALPRLTQITFDSGIEHHPDWSPDGKQIVFCRDVSGTRNLFIKNVETGEETRLTGKGFDDIHPNWCSDNSAILFVRAREKGRMLEPGDVFGVFTEAADIWSIDANTHKEIRLIENGYYPCASPDGTNIVFDASWAGPRRIWMCDRRGRNPQQITSDISEEVAHIRPRWSPDGSKIVFQNLERTKFDLRIVELASRKISWLTNDLFQDLNPVWSPSGRYIYFSSYRSGGLNVWRIAVTVDGRPDGPPHQMTAGPGQDIEISVCRDRRLAFATLKQNADIWRLPVHPESGEASGSPQQVVATTREDSRGAWSPDGTLIAFNSDRSGEMNIWIQSTQDGAARQVTRGAGGDFQPNWSPDRNRLAFFSSRSGLPQVWDVEIASGRLRQLTGGDSMSINPFYSPDGNRIAYQCDRTGRPEVWIMNADGSDAHQVSQIGCGGHFLRWTQDGAWILFRSPYGSSPGSFRISADSEEPQPERLPEVAGGSHMSLSPDQSMIMDVVAHKTLWLSPLTGGIPKKIFEFPDPAARIDYPVWSPDGRWILFDLFRPQGGDIWMIENFETGL